MAASISSPSHARIPSGRHANLTRMGTGTVFNFQPTGGGKAAITGDFVITAVEVEPLIRSLRENGIEVTAIHSHVLNEQPRLFRALLGRR